VEICKKLLSLTLTLQREFGAVLFLRVLWAPLVTWPLKYLASLYRILLVTRTQQMVKELPSSLCSCDSPFSVFSFGMVIYSLISLQEPFYHILNPFSICEAIQEGDSPLLTPEQNARYHPGLILLFKACTHFQPALRPSIPVIQTQLAALQTLSQNAFVYANRKLD
jgi:hypothetical protein